MRSTRREASISEITHEGRDGDGESTEKAAEQSGDQSQDNAEQSGQSRGVEGIERKAVGESELLDGRLDGSGAREIGGRRASLW